MPEDERTPPANVTPREFARAAFRTFDGWFFGIPLALAIAGVVVARNTGVQLLALAFAVLFGWLFLGHTLRQIDFNRAHGLDPPRGKSED